MRPRRLIPRRPLPPKSEAFGLGKGLDLAVPITEGIVTHVGRDILNGSGSSMELEPGREDAPKVAHAQATYLYFREKLACMRRHVALCRGCRLMLACDAVLSSRKNRGRISPKCWRRRLVVVVPVGALGMRL
jgi:hypothetical protein